MAHFCHWRNFNLGGGPAAPLLAYAYAPTEENKKGVRKFSARFLVFSNEISTVQKIVLSSSRGQGNFRGPKASRPRPRTSKCVLEDVLEAKDVLEDSTSANDCFPQTCFIYTFGTTDVRVACSFVFTRPLCSFQLTSAKFQTFAYNSRTIRSSCMKFSF